MIYIRTTAYNAEKTLKRAIDSILQQTYQDFEYHILDNGSTDRTGDIIRAYAEKDRRIVPYFNKVNHDHQENPAFWNLFKHIPEGEYFSILDSDDAYAPTFFQEMLSFMETNHLEVAACGSVFLDAESGETVRNTVMEQNIVARNPQIFDRYFPKFHWNLRQLWGKLYSSRAVAAWYDINNRPDWYPKGGYGGDTINVLQSVCTVKQFGVYAKALHYYTISKKSASYKWKSGREGSDLILHEKTVEFLQDCCGTVSEHNLRFLYMVYCYAVRDTIRVLMNSNLSLNGKLNCLKTILSRELTKQAFSADLSIFKVTDQDQLVQNVLQWLVSQRGYAQEDAPVLVEICTSRNPDFERLVPGDTVLWYLRRTPKTVLALAEKDYLTAATTLAEVLAKGCTELFPVVLAQTLASLLGNQEAYVIYSKFLMELQIQADMYEDAEKALREWETLLPGDEDLAELRKLLP